MRNTPSGESTRRHEPRWGEHHDRRRGHHHAFDERRHHHGGYDGADAPLGRGGPRGRRGGPGRGPDGHGRHREGRAARGDVRAAILVLLGEGPRHGYQVIQDIAERTSGSWRPSPGAVYPALSLLEDEGLVEVTQEGGRRLVTLTEAGTTYLAEHAESFGDPFAAVSRERGPSLRGHVEDLVSAARQVARSGSDAQLEAAGTILADAKRALYLLLAGEPQPSTSVESDGASDTATP